MISIICRIYLNIVDLKLWFPFFVDYSLSSSEDINYFFYISEIHLNLIKLFIQS